MGSGAKTKHAVYVVVPADKVGDPVVVPQTDLPFVAGDIFNADDYLEPHGFDWEANSTSPEAWFNAGFGPGGMAAYVENEITTAGEAKTWFDDGFGPDVAGEWKEVGFYPEAAKAWATVGFLPLEAAKHNLDGLTPIAAAAAMSAALDTHVPLAVQVVEAGTEIAPDLILPNAYAKCPGCGQFSQFDDLPEDFVCPHCGWVAVGPYETHDEPDEAEVEAAATLSAEALLEAAEEAVALEADSVAEETVTDFADVAPATTIADAGKVSEQAWHEAVTPIPDVIPVGDPRGVPLLLGGADLEKGSATIMAYTDPGKGPVHEVLFCSISEAAEQKLLEALAPTEQKLIPVTVTNTYNGRLDFDKEEQIYENLVAAAKSINSHLKAGDGIPAHTVERVNKVSAKLAEMKAAANPALDGMIAFYSPFVSALSERIAPDFSTPYTEGGKTPQVSAFETTWEKEEIEYVPDKSEPTGEDKLDASARQASRVDPTIVDGKATWNGKKRTEGKGVEYVIQLPGGYEAIYHPFVYQGQKLSSDHYSLRGQLELHCPGGEGHAKELVDILGSLNIVNRPMNGAEAEWTYLQQNIAAQGLAKNPAVVKAIDSSSNLEGNVIQQLMLDHAHEAIGKDEKEVLELAQRLTLEAESGVLPLRVRLVRDAVAKTLGIGSGQDLAADPSYQPMPRRSGGWMVFNRFDVGRNKEALAAAFKSKKISVHITGEGHDGSGLLDIFRNGGVLASTERRRIMGARKNSGMSEAADMASGGAKSTFVRLFDKHHAGGGARLEWDDPLSILGRADWYGAPHDTFGSENQASGHTASARTTDLMKVAGFGGNNEIMFRDGLDLLGVDAPSKVVCKNATERDAIRKVLKAQGINELGGRPVDDVVTTS